VHPGRPEKKSEKYPLAFIYSEGFDFEHYQYATTISFALEHAGTSARESSFTIRTQPFGELTPKCWEITRPDRLPHTSHSVKEEGKIVVGQQDTSQHFTG
jgi:hypothetical protein